jgi:hypothetical protein
MNSRIALLSLVSTFLLLALVVAASAQTRTVGVSVGNKFRYRGTASWSSNDPSAAPPSDLEEFNDTQWMQIEIAAVSGTNITGQMTSHYKNGTEVTTGGWVDVDTGNSVNLTVFIISANLGAGDSMYTSSPYNTVTINETVSREYAVGARDTNHLDTSAVSGTLSYHFNYYWDKSTGIAVEYLQETVNQTGAYTTTSLIDLRIISSDLWIVPEFPTWTQALLVLVAVTSAMTIVVKQRRQKGSLR